ncbi:FadR/GntR family transcriptional regulator [Pseudonocardia lacus]|uniref:FadR/GntR family transcriptional regulator n=1 Tax=Pseudonocardia lacus TaxID=2835865 RepID=UPI001BDD5A40|nr:FCD domain-containing protein [Pseudonocardia lacus]
MDRVASKIRLDIMASGWPVGEIIGTEPELVERYGVSRAVVREAIRLVEYLGVARMKQGAGGGLLVTAPDETAVSTAAMVYFAYAGVGPDEVLEARGIVEQRAAELAARVATPEQRAGLAALLAANTATGRATADAPPWTEVHGLVAGLSANPALELLTRILVRVTDWYSASGRRSDAQQRRERRAAAAAHRRIVGAVCAGDEVAAGRAAREHVHQIGAYLTSRRGRRPMTFEDMSSGKSVAKLASVIAAEILTDVVTQDWPVDQHIGSEVVLAEQYDVSRSVVREAVRLLEFHQVVRTRRGPGGGLFVARPTADAVADSLAIHLDFEGVDTTQLFEVRSAMELATVERLAAAADAATIAQLRDALAAHRLVEGRAGRQIHGWHGQLAEAAGNRAVWLFLLALMRLTETRGVQPDAAMREWVDREHVEIIDAIGAGDGARARVLMRDHLEGIRPVVRPRNTAAGVATGP